MEDLEIELSDFDAALDRLDQHADDGVEVRRAIREGLDHLYSLEQSQPAGYWDRVGASEDGQVCAGLTFIRGRAVHRLIRGHEYEILFPSETLYPSKHLFPGGNWVWLDWDDLDPLLPVDDKIGAQRRQRQELKRTYVREHVQGRLVRQTFAEARRFITSPSGGS